MAEAVDDRRGALREEILETHAELIATLDSFQVDDWQRLTPNEGWTAKDTLAHLCIDEREQIACLAGACAKGHSRQARMRAIPAASAGGLNPNVERNGLASPVLSSSSIRS